MSERVSFGISAILHHTRGKNAHHPSAKILLRFGAIDCRPVTVPVGGTAAAARAAAGRGGHRRHRRARTTVVGRQRLLLDDALVHACASKANSNAATVSAATDRGGILSIPGQNLILLHQQTGTQVQAGSGNAANAHRQQVLQVERLVRVHARAQQVVIRLVAF